MKKHDFDYFEYFRTCSRYACGAAELVRDTLTNYDPDKLKDRLTALHKLENEADNAKHDMTLRLSREFITPIEREDIVALAQELDNVVDAADEILQRAYMFNIKFVRPEAVAFAELFVKCCGALASTLDALPTFKKASSDILKHVVQVHSLESAGDTLHSENMRRLFSEETDARELLIWNAIFEGFETCLDACVHASNAVEMLVMKNS